MKISVLTLFPDLYKPFFSTSLIKKAQEKGLLSVEVKDFFSYVAPKERIDSPIVGHGSGMLVKPEVVEKAIEEQDAQHGKSFKIFFSPQGKKLDQVLAAQLAQKLTAYSNSTSKLLPISLKTLKQLAQRDELINKTAVINFFI